MSNAKDLSFSELFYCKEALDTAIADSRGALDTWSDARKASPLGQIVEGAIGQRINCYESTLLKIRVLIEQSNSKEKVK